MAVNKKLVHDIFVFSFLAHRGHLIAKGGQKFGECTYFWLFCSELTTLLPPEKVRAEPQRRADSAEFQNLHILKI